MNTAQAIILIIALGCGYVVYNAYQQSHDTPPQPISPPSNDPKQARYASEVATWQSKLAQQQVAVTWPYHNLDYAVRVDLPDKVPITLAPWDDKSETKVAADTYLSFVQVRKKTHVASPYSCIVHVFLSGTEEEVAQASASGVVTSAQTNLGGG